MHIGWDFKSKKIAKAPYAAKVEIRATFGDTKKFAGTKGKWTQIIYNNTTGWVFGGLLTEKKPKMKLKK